MKAKDLEFISGSFFDCEIPKNQRYLLKYFKTDLQLAFLRYYLVFNEHRNFVDHTGRYCSRRALWTLQARYRHLTKVYETAKKALTEEGMERLHLIELGKFPLTDKAFS
jgi:hypothetical protein